MKFKPSDLDLDETKTPPTVDELLFALKILDKLDGTKLVTKDEEIAICVVTDILVSLSDPFNLHEYDMDRLNLRLKVWHENK